MTPRLCNVGNCGGGLCVHEWTGEDCPHCGEPMIRVKTTGHIFCSGDMTLCGYEIAVKSNAKTR